MRLFDLMMGQPDMLRRPHPMQRQRFVGTGGPGQAMLMYPNAHTGGTLPPQATGGGYDSSGINPHGMYNQGGPLTPPIGQQQMPGRQFPANPGGFQPMGGLTAMFNRYRGG